MASLPHYTTRSGFIPSLNRPNLHSPSSCHLKPSKVVMSNNQSCWTSMHQEVESRIEQALSKLGPASVVDPMHHLIFAAPTIMGPALCIGAYDTIGGDDHREHAIAAASALHLAYSASFTHQHLPLSDQPRTMSKPSSIHHVVDANIELLTGDSLLPLGYELLAGLSNSTHDENISRKILRVTIEIAKAMGSQGMVQGQYMQQQQMESGSEEQWVWVNEVTEKKEGTFYGCSAACGAILGGASEEEIEKLRRIGFSIGMVDGMLMRGWSLYEEKEMLQVVEGFRSMALMELESFQDRETCTLQNLITGCLSIPANQASPMSESYV